MASVEFNQDNVMKCQCRVCPVQAESACVTDKNAALATAMDAGIDPMPTAADVPAVYCSTGVATCTDLDLTQTCVCPGCAVFAENGLGQWKYCERGSAAAIG